ncbi:MAG: CaiB/BaiF CoA-transferase family protein [Pseudomonadota bacterium]
MLEGLKVVEHATYMAAPGAGGVLADWGADVIKIEPPGGDPIRQFFASIGTDITDNPVFDFDNRGKKSVMLDASEEAGREAIRKLADDADVFLTNVRPGGLQRSGLNYETLSKRNPKLVYCALTGYGLDGPDADRPGFDIASFWSRAGVARLTIPKHLPPFPLRTAQGDHTTSLAAVAAINAALLERVKTGKGRLVDVSLLRTGLYTMGSDLAIQLFFGRVASTKPREEATNPLMNFFQTKDGVWLCVVPRQGNGDWAKIGRAFGAPHMIDDERFATPKSRRAHTQDLIAGLDAGCKQFTAKEFAERLDAEQIAWAPVQTLADVVEDPQVIAAGGIVETPSADGDAFKAPASPARFHGADDGPKGPSPKPGEHTEEILSGLGYSAAEIKSMRGEA